MKLRATMVCLIMVLAMLAKSAGLAASQPLSKRSKPLSAADSVRAIVDTSIKLHYVLWRDAWKKSETIRIEQRGLRGLSEYIHCHVDKTAEASGYRMLPPDYRPVTSIYTRFAVCPRWPFRGGLPIADEADDEDSPITNELRPRVEASREALLKLLAKASRAIPMDGVIFGQRIRFLREARRYVEAVNVADGCQAEGWWCALVSGYALHFAGRNVAADSAFAKARKVMTTDQRCQWDDIAPLIAREHRDEYTAATCAEQAQRNEIFWWLADPLYLQPINERRVVNDARKVEVLLHSALAQDSRFHWELESGGDAMAELVIRYGWPSYAAWGGLVLDASHSDYLMHERSKPRPPYTSFEYSRGRVHSAPQWEAIRDWQKVDSSTWTLNDPSLDSLSTWWPEEHFDRIRHLIQIDLHQSVELRRQSDILFASAFELADSVVAKLASRSSAVLMTSTGPAKRLYLDERPVVSGKALFLQGRIPSEAALASMEVRGSSASSLDLRARFVTTPPPTLGSMMIGEYALSAPVLLNASDGPSDLATLGERALDRMLGSTIIRANEPKVGVYWESYGFRAEDSVSVSVQVERDAPPSTLRRLGMALNIADDPRSSIAVTWREPDIGHTTRTLAGPVPVQIRVLTMDFSNIPSGDYFVKVSVGKIGSVPVSSRRRITVERPTELQR